MTIFEAAMAPQIGAAIVAMEHKLDPPLVTLMVGIGIPLSFLTLPLVVVFPAVDLETRCSDDPSKGSSCLNRRRPWRDPKGKI